jgi:folate-binding protein YgfZ
MSDPAGRGPDVATQYDALRSSVGVHRLDRDVVRVWGPDATAYLQGQCSQDVAALGIGSTADALLLSPQGKVEVFMRVTRLGDDEFIVDADGGFGAVLTARLLRFRLRVKVEIEDLPWACLALRGPDAGDGLAHPPELVLPVEWPGFTGFDLLGPELSHSGVSDADLSDAGLAGADAWVDAGVVRCGDEAWEAARIESGVPVNGRELVEGTIAAEAGLVDRTVSFSKGCFTGQELVARLDARGSKVARRLCGLVVGTGDGTAGPDTDPGSLRPPVGAIVSTVEGHEESGHLSSVAWSPRLGTVALATLHRRIVPPETVEVTWEADGGPRVARAEARVLPL